MQPGDVILLDNGAVRCSYPVEVTGKSASPGNCGTVYESTLTPKSAVTIRLGTTGTVIIFGGRSSPLPYRDQSDWNGSNGRSKTINLSSVSDVVVDGVHWAGIMVYGHGSSALDFTSSSRDVLVPSIEVFDNRIAASGGTRTDRPRVEFSGSGATFERAVVHENGQDSFNRVAVCKTSRSVSPGSITSELIRITLYRSFNYSCTHSDGIPIWGGADQSGILVEDSIIGPGFIQGLLLGGAGEPEEPWAVVHDVTVRNTLIFKSTNNNLTSLSNATKPSNWRLEKVTSYRFEGATWWNMFVEGSRHIAENSVFYGGRAMAFDLCGSGNCSFKVQYGLGANEDPQFVDVDEADCLSLDDFTVQNPQCADSSSTSVEMQIGELPTAPLPADLNQDGRVDVLDVQLGMNVYLVGRETESQVISQADVN